MSQLLQQRRLAAGDQKRSRVRRPSPGPLGADPVRSGPAFPTQACGALAGMEGGRSAPLCSANKRTTSTAAKESKRDKGGARRAGALRSVGSIRLFSSDGENLKTGCSKEACDG